MQKSYVIDEYGDVLIILKNLDTSFAEWHDTQKYNGPIFLAHPSDSPESPFGSWGLPREKGKKYRKTREMEASGYLDETKTAAETTKRLESDFGWGSWGKETASRNSLEPADDGVSTDEVRIQVSGKHLVSASPVFKSQLTGRWKESYDLHNEGSVEIEVDSWDPTAFLILMRSFHCRHRDVPKKVTLELLAKIIVLVNYYDCLEAVEVYLNTWLESVSESFPTTYSRDLILWLWISSFLKLDGRFKEVTSIAMRQSKDRVISLGLPINNRILDKINSNREEAISNIISALHYQLHHFLENDSCSFECSSIQLGALKKEMHTNHLLDPRPKRPFLGLGFEELVKTVQSFRKPDCYRNTSLQSGNTCSAKHGRRPGAKELKKYDNSMKGLDLKDF